MHGISMFPCAAVRAAARPAAAAALDHTGGERTAVLRMLCDLGEAAWNRTGLWRGDLAGGMK